MPSRQEEAKLSDQQAHIDEMVLANLPEGCLFYPGCGRDWKHPFNLFRKYVSEFWFADVCMFSRNTADLRQPPPLLNESNRYQLFHRSIEDLGVQPVDDPADWGQPLRHFHCVEKYREDDGRVITVHRWHGYGQNALRDMSNKLSVFFIRRCGNGEGNSAMWFDELLASRLMDGMVPGGLIVTDGAAINNRDLPYGKFHSDHKPGDVEAVKSKKPFRDLAGNQFRCVGYAGDGYGPTLAWQVTKPEH